MSLQPTYDKIVNNLKNLDPRSPAISTYEALAEKKKELEGIGGLLSGGKKKKAQEEYSTLENKLLTQIKEKHLSLYNEMMDNLKTISVVASNQVTGIRGISPPGGADSGKITMFSNDVYSKYESLLDTLKSEAL